LRKPSHDGDAGLHCDCGVTTPIPADATDDYLVTCSACGFEVGTVGAIKEGAFRKAEALAKEAFKGFKA
jgi:hypothetical protein